MTFANQKKGISSPVKKANHLYFRCNIDDQDKSLAPNLWCATCETQALSHWVNANRPSMPFVVPVVWREPRQTTHSHYFCLVPPFFRRKSETKELENCLPQHLVRSETSSTGWGTSWSKTSSRIFSSFSWWRRGWANLVLLLVSQHVMIQIFTVEDHQTQKRIRQEGLHNLVRDLDLSRTRQNCYYFVPILRAPWML